MATETKPTQLNVLKWEARSVEMADIEHELNRLWQEVTGSAQGQPATARAIVLNLVVYTTSDADAERLNETIGRLSGRHPLRAIVLSAEPQHAESSLDTSIHTYCFEDPTSGSPVCCEQVLVGANGEPANHLTGIAMPLLLPDLPLYLWWMGEPQPETENYCNLVRAADKLIVDSSAFAVTPRALRHLLDLARGEGRPCAVNDLNWIRLWPWFAVVAQFFDDPNLLPHLYGIERVTVEYATKPGQPSASPAQAALMAGWLYSRLGGQPERVELQSVETDAAESGNLLSFTMETRHGEDSGRFYVRQSEESGKHADACVIVRDHKLLDRVVLLTDRSQPEMLDMALESAVHDRPYEESLELAATLLEREQSK